MQEGDQSEVDDEKASRDIENATPVDDENTLRQVVRNEEALVRYDRMTQAARAGGTSRFCALWAPRARRSCSGPMARAVLMLLSLRPC